MRLIQTNKNNSNFLCYLFCLHCHCMRTAVSATWSHYFCVISLAFSGNKQKAHLLSTPPRSAASKAIPLKFVATRKEWRMFLGKWEWKIGMGQRSSVSIDFHSFPAGVFSRARHVNWKEAVSGITLMPPAKTEAAAMWLPKPPTGSQTTHTYGHSSRHFMYTWKYF